MVGDKRGAKIRFFDERLAQRLFLITWEFAGEKA
jgi:hypothetical protein